MELHLQRVYVFALIGVAFLQASCDKTALDGLESDADMNSFIAEFPADKLGTTAVVTPSAVVGERGQLKKMLDLTTDDRYASELLVSCRSEYDTNQATVSQTIGAPSPISGATNAAPIVISTPAPHRLITGTNIQISGVIGNTAANGAFTIIVTGPTTFSLTGSDGTLSGVYFAGSGSYQALSSGGTGTGASQIGSPVVGILQWGVGGAFQQLEFDIPSPRWPLLTAPIGFPANAPMRATGNGVIVPVSASHVSLYVRHDGNMSPLNNPGIDFIGNVSPVKVICGVQPGTAGEPKVQRTIFVAGGQTFGGLSSMKADDVVIVNIPPFARTVRFPRIPVNMPLNVQFRKNDGSTYYQEYSVPPNSVEEIPIDGMAEGFAVKNVGAANILHLVAVFDVTPQ